MDLGNGWTTEKLRDEILEHIWIDETGDMGGVHCMHCLGYEQGEIDRAINTVFAAALRRAKAEGMREAAIRAREFSKPYSMEWWRTMTKTGISAAMCRDVADALDARAAQIEEGE